MATRSYTDALASQPDDTTTPDAAQLRTAVEAYFDQAHQLTFEVGRALAEQRAAVHMTQHQLAEVTGVPQADISRIERGKANPTLATVDKLSRAVGLQLVLQRAS